MDRSPHAFEFLDGEPTDLPPVCVVYGDEAFLKQLVIEHLRRALLADDDTPISRLDGSEVEWRDVADELATVSLFGPAVRVVVLRDADDFVKRYRSQLEEYVVHPCQSSTFILEVNSWPGNTRLAKSVADSGITVACRPPERTAGKKKVVDTARLLTWITDWARQQHGLRLRKPAAQQLLDLTGSELGLIDQQLAKLALTVDDDKSEIGPETVVDIVGGWRTKTTWELLDAACDGDAAEALQQLDRLLMAGEHPQAMFGAFSWSLRRFAAASREVERLERRGQRANLPRALLAAGFRKFPPGALQQAEQQLRQLGRQRAGQLYQWLLETDLQLKGSHAAPDRARFAMEMLLLRLSRQARPATNVAPQRRSSGVGRA